MLRVVQARGEGYAISTKEELEEVLRVSNSTGALQSSLDMAATS